MHSNSSPEVRLFTDHQHDLIEALSKNPWEISNILLKEGLISSTVLDKMKVQVYTHHYKAILLVEALQEKIRRDPQMFGRLLDILSRCRLSETLVSNLQKLHHARGRYQRINSKCACVEIQ